MDTSILEQLPVPVLIHSGDALHYANHEFLDLTGYDTVDDLQDAGGLGELFADPYRRGRRADEAGRKLRLRTSEGQEFPVEAFLQSVPWRGGKALLLSLRRSGASRSAIRCAVGDASRRSRARGRIAEMRTIIDTATDGVVLIAPRRHDPLDQPAGRGAVRLRQRRGRRQAVRPRCSPSRASARRATISTGCPTTASPACSMTAAR